MGHTHGDVETMKMLNKEILLNMIAGIFKHGDYPAPTDEIISIVSEYLFKIVNGEGIHLKAEKTMSVTKHFANKKGTVTLVTIQDILFTSGVTENIEYWSSKIDSLNRIEYCEHSDDFEDPFCDYE